MASFSFMAIIASIVSLAAFEFDGDNIQLASIMGTAGMRVYLNAMNGDAMNDRRHTGFVSASASAFSLSALLRAGYWRIPLSNLMGYGIFLDFSQSKGSRVVLCWALRSDSRAGSKCTNFERPSHTATVKEHTLTVKDFHSWW